MDPNDFGGIRANVKVTIDMHGTKLVNMIENKPLCVYSSNLADMLAVVRGWTLLIWRSMVMITKNIYGNKLVKMIETKPLCVS